MPFTEKSFPGFISKLKKALEKGLPGEIAQLRMAPASRHSKESPFYSKTEPKLGAVLILLYPHAGSIKIALIQRPEYEGHHSKQISFPGGKKEEGDDNLYTTALRETEEEIGVSINSVKYLGQLSDLYIPVSNFKVSPFLGIASQRPDFKINEKEVEDLLEVELSALLNKAIIRKKKIQLANGAFLETPYYDIYGRTIWGATAMIISEFNSLLE